MASEQGAAGADRPDRLDPGVRRRQAADADQVIMEIDGRITMAGHQQQPFAQRRRDGAITPRDGAITPRAGAIIINGRLHGQFQDTMFVRCAAIA